MKAVVLAAGKGTRLQPLTNDKPKALVEVDGRPILEHCLDTLSELDAEEFILVVGHRKEQIIARFGDEYRNIPITYAHQREALGLAHAVLTAEEHVDDDFMLMLGDNIFEANLGEVVARQHDDHADAAFLVEEVPWDEASRYGVCVTNDDGDIVEVVEKPDNPESNLVMTGFYTFSPAIFHACNLVQPSDRGEYELPDAIDLLIRSGRTISAIPCDGWRVDVGYPEDRDRAERLIRAERGELGLEELDAVERSQFSSAASSADDGD
ncbi:sugar nucleotidyltransferase [Halogeometricum borinquense]|uniref:Sugar nucleotidyltransferase n=1 Tax=Halogeometricum borinquense TaxID=60847 RepID=A0A482TGV7_9EURY|nr:UTP--glucose-1-phosphate uridylyltransferase AglF [Halogeometricum borinquense]RYJ13143.1 sugar nucleotidyltransferase [Halogeometricum borinquense]